MAILGGRPNNRQVVPYLMVRDGRAALGPVLREYIVSEAMFALGIPTTRSLAASSATTLTTRGLELG